MEDHAAPTTFYDFGVFRIDPVNRELLREGLRVPLTPRAFDTLLFLARNGGRLVRRRELLQAVWPGTFVSDGTLTQNIHTLRKILSEAGAPAAWIETVPRRGYRFTAPVRNVPVPPQLAGPTIQVLAVLPPVTFGAEEDKEFLGLGIADALITSLGRLQRLTVRPTSAIYRYASGAIDPVEAGRELRADAVVQGTVQRLGTRIRVSVQLVRVSDGASLWSDRFDEVFTDAFAAQDAIAQRVVHALRLELTPEERLRLRDDTTPSAVAHLACVKGRYFWNKRTLDGLQRAIRYFEEALLHEESYAPAHAGLADCHALLSMYGDQPAPATFPQAREAAHRALALDPALAEAHASLAYALLFYDWKWAEAEAGFRRAIELRPGYSTAHHWYSFLLAALGRADEAAARCALALELEPLSLAIGSDLGLVLYFARRYEEAAAQFERTLELDPEFAYAHFGLSLVHEQLGRAEEAVEQARRAVDHSGESTVMLAAFGRACAVAGRRDEARSVLGTLAERARHEYVEAARPALILEALGEADAALEQLRLACDERSRFVVFLDVWPVFDRLRADARFCALVERVGLPRKDRGCSSPSHQR